MQDDVAFAVFGRPCGQAAEHPLKVAESNACKQGVAFYRVENLFQNIFPFVVYTTDLS